MKETVCVKKIMIKPVVIDSHTILTKKRPCSGWPKICTISSRKGGRRFKGWCVSTVQEPKLRKPG